MEGNLGWCKPYLIKQNGKIAYFVLNEGEIVSIQIDDKEVEDSEAEKALIENFGEDYLEESKELDCVDCPWYNDCEAMDDEREDEEDEDE